MTPLLCIPQQLKMKQGSSRCVWCTPRSRWRCFVRPATPSPAAAASWQSTESTGTFCCWSSAGFNTSQPSFPAEAAGWSEFKSHSKLSSVVWLTSDLTQAHCPHRNLPCSHLFTHERGKTWPENFPFFHRFRHLDEALQNQRIILENVITKVEEKKNGIQVSAKQIEDR